MFPFRGTLCRLSIENQPIASKILTQTSRYKRAESNLLADEKGTHHWNQLDILVIHLYLYI